MEMQIKHSIWERQSVDVRSMGYMLVVGITQVVKGINNHPFTRMFLQGIRNRIKLP